MSAADALRLGWGIDGELEPYGDGHINSTYLVRSGSERYVLQRVNEAVFLEPHVVMSNVERVIAHARNIPFAPLLRTLLGAACLQNEQSCWRLWGYVPGASFAAPQNLAQARLAGAAFAHFHRDMASLPQPRLADPIPGFHQFERYLAQYDTVVSSADQALFAQVLEPHRPLAQRFSLPNRYIHGDPKFNNLLFSNDGAEVVALLDLDTVMWGHWAWDYGDLVRSVCMHNGDFQLARYTAVTQGFAPALDLASVEDLVLAPRYVAAMLAVRFYTDHHQGDRYFLVSQRGQNLARAKQQFQLLHSMWSQESAMLEVAEQVLRSV